MEFESRAIHKGQEPDPATGAVTHGQDLQSAQQAANGLRLVARWAGNGLSAAGGD